MAPTRPLYDDRAAAVTITLDGWADDGEAGEGDNARTDVENAVGGSGNDMISGSTAVNSLSGGAGNDQIASADGVSDHDACGAGDDTVSADSSDAVDGDCEHTTCRSSPPPSIAIFGTAADEQEGHRPDRAGLRPRLGRDLQGQVETGRQEEPRQRRDRDRGRQLSGRQGEALQEEPQVAVGKPLRRKGQGHGVARDDSGTTKTGDPHDLPSAVRPKTRKARKR